MRRIVTACALLLLAAACSRQSAPQADYETIAAVRYRAPGPAKLTLYTMVNNRTGSGGHASLMINASERVIFDPAGSFRADSVPERDDVLYGITPAVEKAYRGSHARSTFHVIVQELEVTQEQAEAAYLLAKQMGPVPGAFCANYTGRLLRQVPGFEDIRPVLQPVRLADQFGDLPGAVTERYYEYDDEDLQKGIAANNAKLNEQATSQY